MIAAITAGGKADDPFARSLGVAVKGLALVDNTTSLARSISAARSCGAERIVVIGGEAVARACASDVDRVIPEGNDGSDNIRHAIETAVDRPLLLMTSDMPFIETAGLADFLARANGADIALPLAEAGDYRTAFPGAPDHITQIGRDRIANGNVVYFGPGVAPRALEVAQRLFEARKSLIRMAALLGPVLLARFVVGRLGIEDVERRGSELFGLRVRGVRHAAPSLCFDIDTADDIVYARAFAERAR